MKVTAVKAQVKNPDRVSVFVDGKYSFSLTLDQMLAYAIKKGLELDEPRLEELKRASDEGKLKTKALDWLLIRPHSTRELRDYGFRKKLDKELVQSWIEEFQAKKYLDDEAFARWFAENRVRKHKSARAIIAELGSKGIGQDIAEPIVSELTSDTTALEQLVAKLRTRPRYKDDQKLIVHLAQKGFKYADIKRLLTPDS